MSRPRFLDLKIMTKIANKIRKSVKRVNSLVSKKASKYRISTKAALALVAKDYNVPTTVYQNKLEPSEREEFRSTLLLANNINDHGSKKKKVVSQYRQKQQKFKILDAPGLLSKDLQSIDGFFGIAVLFIDLDDFKFLNSNFTETVVDKEILPSVHNLLKRCVNYYGYAYAMGGDEFAYLLPNCTQKMAIEFAKAVRKEIERLQFSGSVDSVKLTASIGLSYEHPPYSKGLDHQKAANLAKNHAKESGKNCVCELIKTKFVIH